MIQREAQHEQSQYGQESGRLMTSCGGIIADVMGLGKTLTVLASILYSASDAEAFQRSTLTTSDTQEFQLYTKATLVVVSSTQLLDSWCSEVKRHFDPGVLNISMFHGLSRQQDLRALAGSDIVLTTYATIVAEEKGKNTLQQLCWFRIVLDEAHWIRNARSKTFRAVTGLLARNRWCLTGTPVQNKLEDIASLAAFLQLQPFPTKGEFQRRVLDPLFQGGNNFSKPLRTWLRAVCIRRTEKLLQLPESKEETISVILSPPERQLYDRVLYEIKHDIDDNVSKGKNIKNYNILLNLTVANRVHIVEPQWNPSVEEQAVARALRMGQEREVTVFRYVAQGTVEQNIMHLQKKKKIVAKFMFNVGVAEELNGRLEDLKFVLSLNSKPKS
ncbi:putative SWI/SNF-related matrix-associated actin-dependent regulator of chromatin subfamily A member 3-like 1 [Colletotrichum siamense]|uniref:uncharacterized protein n=1 Tax=Colletotrichum siamense TaxID=690259 RepID=UPI0018728342|nr:uncharacterized protein CGCS363_v006141 [Colletotrichum siamense]KAF5500394.1 putative SWI/SNF-related matrix-associated actin-dependent regulator of chromatin subfamily A member 3-like 1 [Colletotrichum siamense]